MFKHICNCVYNPVHNYEHKHIIQICMSRHMCLSTFIIVRVGLYIFCVLVDS